ncbi:hypothetical protein EV184_109225 [Sinorhizobium americanum]|nr:hypothetical protein EV184_109225 [Sinorhizobium americanum]
MTDESVNGVGLMGHFSPPRKMADWLIFKDA